MQQDVLGSSGIREWHHQQGDQYLQCGHVIRQHVQRPPCERIAFPDAEHPAGPRVEDDQQHVQNARRDDETGGRTPRFRGKICRQIGTCQQNEAGDGHRPHHVRTIVADVRHHDGESVVKTGEPLGQQTSERVDGVQCQYRRECHTTPARIIAERHGDD